MFALLSLTTLALSAASAVNGVAIPRDTTASAPSSYDSAVLEPYATYNARYLALDCQDKHDTSFFDDCCHPLAIGQSLSSRPAYCTPGNATSTVSSATATITPAPVNAAAAPPAASAISSVLSGIDAVAHNGMATWFYQNGVAGACGTVHADTDKIVALDSNLYGDTSEISQYCGKTLVITNNLNGKQVTAIVADACPTCVSSDSIDLSQGAFTELDALSVGTFSVSWHFTD